MSEKARILIVEDESFIYRMIEDHLELLGYRPVGSVAYGEQVLEQAQRLSPDLILMDVRLAGEMEGIEAAKLVKRELNIPVIFLTALSDSESLERIKAANPLGYLTKPFKLEDLHTNIEMALYRQQIEQKLHESQARYQSVVETASEGIVTIDASGIITMWNREAERMFGYPADEILGKPITAIIPQRLQETYQKGFQELVKNPNSKYAGQKIQLTGRRSDSSEFPAEMTLATWNSGQQTFVTGIITDITERTRTVAALQESELRYRTLVENAPIGIGLSTPDGRSLVGNEAMTQITGFTAEEIEDLDLSEMYQDPQERDRILQQMQAGEQIQGRKVMMKRKDGTPFHARLTISPLNLDGKSVLMALLDDITEPVKVEQALRRERDFAEGLINTAQVIVLVLDTDGRIVRYNPYLEQLSGLSLDEVKGQDWFETFLPKEDHQRIQQVFDQAVADSQSRGTVNPILCKDGRQRLIEWSDKALRDPEGKVMGVLAIGQDITERAQATHALQLRNREMELLNQASQAFSSTLELDQVLAAILEEVRRLLNVVACSVWLVDQQADEVKCHQASGPHGAILRGQRLPIETGLVGWVARTGKSLNVPDTQVDERHYHKIDGQTGLAIRSILSVPLVVKKQIIGVLQVVDSQINRFDASHLDLLGPLAAAAAIAVENAQLYAAERQARQQLRDLAGYLQHNREQERTHIAREIHDELGQVLTALKIDLSWLGKHMPSENPSVAQRAGGALNLVDSAITTVRRLATQLRPGLLDDLGLAAAVEWQAKEFADRVGLVCKLELDEEHSPLEQDLTTAVFRIFQESLTNIARHSQASQIQVKLEDSSDQIVLTVRDNGVGITTEQATGSGSLGLTGMRERAHSWGGSVTFEGVPGQGTTVTVHMPRER